MPTCAGSAKTLATPAWSPASFPPTKSSPPGSTSISVPATCVRQACPAPSRSSASALTWTSSKNATAAQVPWPPARAPPLLPMPQIAAVALSTPTPRASARPTPARTPRTATMPPKARTLPRTQADPAVADPVALRRARPERAGPGPGAPARVRRRRGRAWPHWSRSPCRGPLWSACPRRRAKPTGSAWRTPRGPGIWPPPRPAIPGPNVGQSSGPPGQGHGPPGPADLHAAEFLRILGITANKIIRGACNHAQAEARYRPGRKLQHVVAARNTRCTAPGCGQPAIRCDLDHTTAYQHGGRTCQCNLAPPCQR